MTNKMWRNKYKNNKIYKALVETKSFTVILMVIYLAFIFPVCVISMIKFSLTSDWKKRKKKYKTIS